MSAGVAGRGFERAPGRWAVSAAAAPKLVLRDAEIAEALEAAEPGELLDSARERR